MLPTFLIIGAQRAGTTSLYRYVGQHPAVFVSPVKETNFFAADWSAIESEDLGASKASIRDVNAYRHLFQGSEHCEARGEASPSYLSAVGAPDRIHGLVPDTKLIVLLRNPIERAYSRYLQARLKGREQAPTFEEALDHQSRLLDQEAWLPWKHGFVTYYDGGMYAKHIERYWTYFAKGQLGVWLYDDLRSDTAKVCAEVFDFIGVDSAYEVQTERFNASGVPRSALLDRAIRAGRNTTPAVKRWVRRWMPDSFHSRVRSAHNRNFEKPQMKSDTRAHLVEVFRADVERLQRLIGRDLSHWLAV